MEAFLYNEGMEKQILEKGGERTVAAQKDRERLTIYVDSAYHKKFRSEASSSYRSLSDHMNAILAERYGKSNGKAARAKGKTPSTDGR